MSEEVPTNQIAVPLLWDVPEDTPTHYATNMVVQFTDHEFLISFFEVYPPLLVGTPEEIDQQAAAVETVKARCIARIVVAADRMPGFVNAFQTNLEKYVSRHEGSDDE